MRSVCSLRPLKRQTQLACDVISSFFKVLLCAIGFVTRTLSQWTILRVKKKGEKYGRNMRSDLGRIKTKKNNWFIRVSVLFCFVCFCFFAFYSFYSFFIQVARLSVGFLSFFVRVSLSILIFFRLFLPSFQFFFASCIIYCFIHLFIHSLLWFDFFLFRLYFIQFLAFFFLPVQWLLLFFLFSLL